SWKLVDATVPRRIAKQAAARHVLGNAPAKRARGLEKWLNHPWLKPLVARRAAKSVDKQDPHHHYPAPRAILDVWKKQDGRVLRSPDEIEDLTQSASTRNLMRVFMLQERLKHLGRQTDPTRFGHVHVVGAGTMGAGIAAWCTFRGLRVSLQDLDRDHIAKAQGQAAALFDKRLHSHQDVQAAWDRLIPDPDGHGARHADIVIEAISENPEHKQQLFKDLEARMRPDAILASNTSSLSLTTLAEGLVHPEQIGRAHV